MFVPQRVQRKRNARAARVCGGGACATRGVEEARNAAPRYGRAKVVLVRAQEKDSVRAVPLSYFAVPPRESRNDPTPINR